MNGVAPIVIDPRLLEVAHALTEPEVPGASVFRRGKVRTVFHAGPDQLVIVASDRLSAYDSVLPTPIPGKGVMVATDHRLVNTVLNRCKMPSDGGILVPVHTVCVIGTTDEKVTDPELLRRIEPSPSLLRAVLRTKHLMNPQVLALARRIV